MSKKQKSKGKKCFVKPCTNHSEQGSFMGNVCVPCFNLAFDIELGKLKGSYNFQPGVVRFISDNWREVMKQAKWQHPEEK